MTFLSPGRLWLLTLVGAVAVAYLVLNRRTRAYSVRFTNLALLDRVAPRRPGWRRHLPFVLFLLMSTVLVGAFARPADQVEVPVEVATVIVAIDVSGSMGADDVPPTRLEAAKAAAKKFVQGLPPRFSAGLVKFATSASVVAAPTTDHDAIARAVDLLEVEGATAIGEAVFAGLDAIRTYNTQLRVGAGQLPPAAIVLLSDGESTRGRTVPEAITAATRQRVAVSTIAYGTPQGVILDQGRAIPVPPSKETLRLLAEGTRGRAYEAESVSELDRVYADIGTAIGHRLEYREIVTRFVGVALALALAAALASLVLASRLP